jgi:hypothetical protein
MVYKNYSFYSIVSVCDYYIPMNFFLLPIAILGFSFNTYASFTVCEVNGKIVKKAIYDTSEITAKKACEFGKHVENLLSPVLKTFKNAPKISLRLMPEFDNASYDNGSMIKIPIKFYSLDRDDQKNYKRVKDLDAIILHEYGHALLASYLVAQWDSFDFYSASGHRISELEQQNLLTPSEKLEKKINDEKKELMSSRSMRTFTKSITPYQELFADILSTFELNDKDAVFNAITSTNDIHDNYLLYLGRSFSEKDFNLGKMSLFPHSYFYKVRQFIGASFWPVDEKDKTEKLQKLIELIQHETIYSSYDSYFMTDPQLDNEELIQKIRDI